MRRKVFGFLVLIVFVPVYMVSSCQGLTIKLNMLKDKSNSQFGSDKHRYGDLFGLSYLSPFKKPKEDSLKVPDCKYGKKINLYEICDSYMFLFFNSTKYYCGVNKLTQVITNNGETLSAKLDTSKINVLLLEFSERNVRVLLADSDYIKNLVSENSFGSSKGKLKEVLKTMYHFLFNKEINTNLEYNLWDYSILTPLKEFKADLNYRLFGTVDKDVKLSKDGKQLFYAETIDTAKISSSFNPLSDNEISVLTGRLNEIYQEARKAGFNKVYLSIIPNPVSVLAPDYNNFKYNNLVSRVQGDRTLKFPYIDVLSSYHEIKSAAYDRSDTHWSWRGAYIWLDKFNMELANSVRQHN